jgi:hypothetical protein
VVAADGFVAILRIDGGCRQTVRYFTAARLGIARNIVHLYRAQANAL